MAAFDRYDQQDQMEQIRKTFHEQMDEKIGELEGHLEALRKMFCEGLDDASLRKWAVDLLLPSGASITSNVRTIDSVIKDAEVLVNYVNKGTAGRHGTIGWAVEQMLAGCFVHRIGDGDEAVFGLDHVGRIIRRTGRSDAQFFLFEDVMATDWEIAPADANAVTGELSA